MKLTDALGNLSPAELQVIAQAHGLGYPPNPMRPELIALLARHLAKPDVIKATLAALGPKERQGLDTVISDGGRVIARIFEREFGLVRYASPYAIGRPQQWSTPQSTAEALFYRGLLYRAFGSIGAWNGELYVIPDELLAALPKVKRPSFGETLASAPEPAHKAVHGDLLRDIGLFLCYLQRETVRAVRGDRLAKRDLLRLNDELSLRQDVAAMRNEEEASWISFVHYMAQLLGLIRVQGGVISPAEKVDEWLRQTRERQTRDAWQHYLKDGTWNDVGGVISTSHIYSAGGPQHVAASRARVVDNLKQCPVGQWLTPASFEQAIRAHDPLFLRAQAISPGLASWNSSDFYGAWQDVESPLITYLLLRPLSWFGVVETGGSAAQPRAAAFRLTERGGILLGVAKGTLADAGVDPITVQPNFEIVAPMDVSPSVLYYLQQIAQLAKSDRANIYILNQNAVWRNLQAGGDIERIISFLERAGQRPLPQNVAFSLREWAGKHGELRVEQVMLLTASSDALMAEVRASKKISLKLKEAISPRAVVLADADVAALVEQLRKAGYWPKAGAGVPGAVKAAEAGRSIVTIKSNDLVHLLVGALVLAHISHAEGCNSPVSDSLIRNLSWNLPPVLVKQVQRMAQEAIARYESQTGEEPDEGQ